MLRRKNLLATLLALALAALLAAGCGSEEDGTAGSEPPDYAKLLAGAPAPLAALHAEGDELIPGGKDALEARIDELAGYPVVVNIWGSWCGPCRQEFPMLQQQSAAHGKKVAFLGVDTEDSDDAAATYLAEAPVPYPSFTDPGGDVKGELGARGLPSTAYYGSDGELCYLKQGAYADEEAMEADIRTYALEGECPESG